MLAARVDVGNIAFLALVERPEAFISKKIGEAENGVERSAQFMAHGGEELVFKSAAALGFLFGLDEGDVRGFEAAIRFLDFGGALIDFGFHLSGARAQVFG